MSRPKAVLIIVCSLWLGLTAPVSALATTEDGAAQHIAQLSAEAIALLKQKDMSAGQREAELSKLLFEGFDVDLIGRIALGKAWRKATPEQRKDYLNLFGDYVVKTYANRLGSYAGETIKVVSTRPTGKKDVFVETRIDRGSQEPIRATWRVREVDGENKIVDVMVEGISLVITQRDEFGSIVRNNGMDGLIEILRAKTERLSAVSS